MTRRFEMDFGADQHQGARYEQQDFFGSFGNDPSIIDSESGFLAVLADGMGGMNNGAQASYLAVTQFIKEYKEKQPDEPIVDALDRSLLQTNNVLVLENNKVKADDAMGATLTACVVRKSDFFWISVGDSPLFLFREGHLQRINQDHSYGGELDRKLKAGRITFDQTSSENNSRNMLTSYLGLEHLNQIDLSTVPIELKPFDKVLLCSDGLIDALSPFEICQALELSESAQTKCEKLIKQALDKQIKNQDNITVLLFEMEPLEKVEEVESSAQVFPRFKLGYGLIIGVLLLLIWFTWVFIFDTKEQPEKASPVHKGSAKGQGQGTQESVICENIKCYQAILKSLKQYDGAIDGRAGKRTEAGLMTFQRLRLLDENPTGKMDQKTCQQLLEVYKEMQDSEIIVGNKIYPVKFWCQDHGDSGPEPTILTTPTDHTSPHDVLPASPSPSAPPISGTQQERSMPGNNREAPPYEVPPSTTKPDDSTPQSPGPAKAGQALPSGSNTPNQNEPLP